MSPSLGPAPLALGLARRLDGVTSSAIRDLLALTSRPDVLSLAGGLPAPDAFPVGWIREEIDRQLRRQPDEMLQYATTEGHEGLRTALAGQEGWRCDRPIGPEAVLITSGAQQAIDLVARALFDPDDVVVVEDPAYLGALQVFRLAGARLEPVPVDESGLDVDILAERLEGGLRPKVVYVVPHFQNPTGTTLSLARRRQLALLADRYGFWILEDDPYVELRFAGTRLPSLGAFTERVIRLGSFSKTLAPGLRCGWLAAPSTLVRALVRVKQAADLQTSSFVQPVIAALLADHRRMDAHLAGLRRIYADRAEALTRSLTAEFGSSISFRPPSGGMFVWARLGTDIDTRALLPKALDRGVAFVPGGEFLLDPSDRSWMRLGYATLPPRSLALAARRLAQATADLAAP